MSARFKRLLPLLHEVENFAGVRIHRGNTVLDTEGCLLIGLAMDGQRVLRTTLAEVWLVRKMQECAKAGEEVYVTIKRREDGNAVD
jgi:hypothetical protein